jgi:hypothetical protein
MPRKKRSGFGDVLIDRAAFERGEGRCPSCRRPIGPDDHPTLVRSFGPGPSTMATMRCGRCSAMLTLRFTDTTADELSSR